MTRRHPSIVLAVSGGLDSMCLLHMAHRSVPPGTRLRVANFDHRSGPHATAAVRHVKAAAARLGLPIDVGRSRLTATSESAWRAARWRFLRDVAARDDAVVATAHTLDDHLETVVMRLLRGAGARGLAGLLAETPGIVRPLIGTPRAALANYAQQHGIAWQDDPTNLSRRFFRNRVRLDLLPAIRRADPQLPDVLLQLSRDAADLRRDIERFVARWSRRVGDGVHVSEDVLRLTDTASRTAAWPAMLGLHQVVLDRRGLVRLAALTETTPRGARVPLSGGWEATRTAEGVRVVRIWPPSPDGRHPLPAVGELQFGGWRFSVRDGSVTPPPDDPWIASFDNGIRLDVRAWEAGDRITTNRGGATRRVKRFFADLRIPANERKGWPVVIANDEINWIPGVRRANAASVRSGGPVRLVVCERIHY